MDAERQRYGVHQIKSRDEPFAVGKPARELRYNDSQRPSALWGRIRPNLPSRVRGRSRRSQRGTDKRSQPILSAYWPAEQANILVDDYGTARLADFGLMTISVDLSTIPLSATTFSSAGTVRWMSPELLFGQNSPPSRESDCYALGMVVYEVSWLHSLRWSFTYPTLGPDRSPTILSPRFLCGNNRCGERGASKEARGCRVSGFL